MNFGRIEELPVRGGDPVLDPPPVVVTEYKFAAENGPRAEAGLPDFRLKRSGQRVPLHTRFEVMVDGTNGNTTLKPVVATLGSTHFTTSGAVFFRAPQGETLPLWCSWAVLLALAMVCLYMLRRKIRGAEVVR